MYWPEISFRFRTDACCASNSRRRPCSRAAAVWKFADTPPATRSSSRLRRARALTSCEPTSCICGEPPRNTAPSSACRTSRRPTSCLRLWMSPFESTLGSESYSWSCRRRLSASAAMRIASASVRRRERSFRRSTIAFSRSSSDMTWCWRRNSFSAASAVVRFVLHAVDLGLEELPRLARQLELRLEALVDVPANVGVGDALGEARRSGSRSGSRPSAN